MINLSAGRVHKNRPIGTMTPGNGEQDGQDSSPPVLLIAFRFANIRVAFCSAFGVL